MTIKRIIILMGIVLLVATFGWSQDQVSDSILSNTSFGVFSNELDGAANAREESSGPGFSELTNSYIFGGLANIDQAFADNSTVSPYWFGYYMAGDMPWSVFFRLDNNAANYDEQDQTISTDTVTVTDDDGNQTVYNWTDSETTRTIDTLAFNSVNDEAQFLINFGNINTGLYFQYNLNNDYAVPDNYSETETVYYDTVTANTDFDPTTEFAEPQPEEDYTRTLTQTNYSGGGGKVTTLDFDVPLFLKGDGMSHYVRLGFDSVMRDRTFNRTESYETPTTGNLGSYTNTVANNDVITGSDIGGNGEYVLTMAGLLGDHERNEFYAGAYGGLTAFSAERSRAFTQQTFNYNGGTSAWERATRNEDTWSYTFENSSDWYAGAWAQHGLYFDVGSAVDFGVRPWTFLNYSMNGGNPRITQQVQTDRVDNDNNGSFDDDGDTITTTTTNYTNAMFNVTTESIDDAVTSGTLLTGIGLPASIQVQPEGWRFGAVLGAQPVIRFQRITTTTMRQGTETVTAVRTVGDDPETVTTTNTTPATATDTSYDNDWNAEVDHYLSVYVMVNENIRVDAALNGSLLEFDNFQIQAIIGLP